MSRDNNKTSVELDAKTASLLGHLAEIWGVSENEALRRALVHARTETESQGKGRLDAFEALQRSLKLTPEKASDWQRLIRDARR